MPTAVGVGGVGDDDDLLGGAGALARGRRRWPSRRRSTRCCWACRDAAAVAVSSDRRTAGVEVPSSRDWITRPATSSRGRTISAGTRRVRFIGTSGDGRGGRGVVGRRRTRRRRRAARWAAPTDGHGHGRQIAAGGPGGEEVVEARSRSRRGPGPGRGAGSGRAAARCSRPRGPGPGAGRRGRSPTAATWPARASQRVTGVSKRSVAAPACSTGKLFAQPSASDERTSEPSTSSFQPSPAAETNSSPGWSSGPDQSE